MRKQGVSWAFGYRIANRSFISIFTVVSGKLRCLCGCCSFSRLQLPGRPTANLIVSDAAGATEAMRCICIVLAKTGTYAAYCDHVTNTTAMGVVDVCRFP